VTEDKGIDCRGWDKNAFIDMVSLGLIMRNLPDYSEFRRVIP
jgi:hypothetical protein